MPVTGTCPLEVEEGATITFSGWGDETEQKIYRDSIERFTALCPGVTVDYQPVPDKFQDKLKAQMAGGTAPDVFYVDDQLMNAFAPSGQLLPLDDYMDQAGVSRDDFIPALMTIFTRDDQTYALPKDCGTLGLIYLPEAFQAAGVDEPTDDWTTIRGFIFDLDGVLTDTAEYHYRGWKRLADELGIPFTREDNEHLRGIPRRESLLLILKDRHYPEEKSRK